MRHSNNVGASGGGARSEARRFDSSCCIVLFCSIFVVVVVVVVVVVGVSRNRIFVGIARTLIVFNDCILLVKHSSLVVLTIMIKNM